MSDFCRERLAFAVTAVGHRTYAYACAVRVNQPLLFRCFILVIPSFSIPAFNFWLSISGFQFLAFNFWLLISGVLVFRHSGF